MVLKIGDEVQLVEPFQSRRYPGKVHKITKGKDGNNVMVALPNGLFAVFPEERWELIKSSSENKEEGEREQ